MTIDKKICIITLTDIGNYGNRLQNYALTTLLQHYTSNVEAVIYKDYWNDSKYLEKLRPLIRKMKLVTKGLFERSQRLENIRINRNIHFTKDVISHNNIRLSSQYGFEPPLPAHTVCVMGSDQIWNDRLWDMSRIGLMLGSAVENAPMISYAASFGVNRIAPEHRDYYREQLNKFTAISVREFQGAKIVKELTGRDAQVVLDPTLMLDANEWKKIFNSFVSKEDKYVLTYFLGKPNSTQQKVIDNYAKRHGCRIRKILDFSDPETYIADPADFVELVANAKYVFTDSFHACCFSILFNKQFKVFNRKGYEGNNNMNSRMETLAKLFDLPLSMGDSNNLTEIDYDTVNVLLEEHRTTSRKWLEQALQQVSH